MPTDTFALVGAGGHALVVLDAFFASGQPSQYISIYSEDTNQVGNTLIGIEISLLEENSVLATNFHLAIGANEARRRLFSSLSRFDTRPITITHPSSTISQHAEIEDGCFVAAGAIVAPRCHIGRSCIVNHGAIVDHECLVGDFTHIAPGASIAGGVVIGKGTLVGSGARVLPGINIGEDAVIGAGAVVSRNVPDGATWAGVPARPIRSENT